MNCNIHLKICKNFLTGLRTQFAAPQQGILLGIQDRNASRTTNTVKCIIPYWGNDQELITQLATYMNHKGLSIIGWILVTDRESSYQRIAQSYFETFASALLKVLIANCATLNAHHPQSNPRLIGEEAAHLLQHMTGILIFDGVKHSASSDDFISSGFFGFHYPISTAEIISKIMSMDQIMHDLPCDPVETHILAEFQSGLAGSGVAEDKMDVGLLESLTLSAASGSSFYGKKFRSRRNASNPNSATATTLLTNVASTSIEHQHHNVNSSEDSSQLPPNQHRHSSSNSNNSSSTASSLMPSSIAAGEDSVISFAQPLGFSIESSSSTSTSQTTSLTIGAGAASGKAKASLMPEHNVEIIFGSGGKFIQDSLHDSPLLYCPFDQELFPQPSCLPSSSSSTLTEHKLLDQVAHKQAILMQHKQAFSEMLAAYEEQSCEVEQLLLLWRSFGSGGVGVGQ